MAASAPQECAAASVATASRSGGFGFRLLGAVSGEGRVNALVSPLGIGAVLSMAAQGAAADVRRSIGAMLAGARAAASRPDAPVAGGSSGKATEGTADRAEPGAGGSENRGRGEADPGVALPCTLAAVLAAASDDADIELQAVSGAFADRRLDIYPSFSAALRYRFSAAMERLAFAEPGAVERINDWAARSTKGKIARLVTKLEPDDALVLANAMHFRGLWSRPFDPELTAPMPFRLQTGRTVEATGMRADDLSARYRESAGFQAVVLPYGDGGFALTVVLPREDLPPAAALAGLASDPSWLGGAGFRRARGRLVLPRLSLKGEASLLPVLRSLGLETALKDPDSFAGIAAPAPLLSRVLHRTQLALDEKGTEAAAATAAVMTTRAAVAEESFEMKVDRPFALAVRHLKSGALLFAAWVADPADGG